MLKRIWSALKRHKKKSIAGAVLLLLVGGGAAMGGGGKQPEYVTADAKRGDLVQTVEAVGTVTSERDLELKFSMTGIVDKVLVKEGDRVRAGQILAQLRAGTLGADVAAQSASLQQAIADLRTMEAGSRPEDIAIAEADVASKRASLEAARSTLQTAESSLQNAQRQLDAVKQEANITLSGQVDTAKATLSTQLVNAENALAVVDDVLSKTIIQDAITKDKPGADNSIRLQSGTARASIQAVRTSAALAADYQAALKVVQDAQKAIQQAASVVDATFNLVSSLPETAYLNASTRETYKNTLATERSAVQSALGSLASALSSFQNAAASFDTKIIAQQATIDSSRGTKDKAQADIITYQAAVSASEAALNLKKAGARKTELDAARARVRLQQASVARASAQYNETILRSPVDGVVTKVNVKVGETLPVDAAVTLLGNSPYHVEMFVSEIDVPKVQLSQSGSIELDAFRGTNFKLHVSQVDSAATDRDGVPKYKVLLSFDYDHADKLKIGMTGDAAIVTGMRTDVVYIPLRAVLDDEEEQIVRILKEDKTVEEREVETGMEDASGNVEVTGVQEGEVVIVLEKK